MSYVGKQVLVTGAAGFIGSHLAERLVQEGAKVRCFIRYNSSSRRGWLDHSPAAEEMEFVAGDIRDADIVHAAVEGCDMVFHLAALIGIPYSYVSPEAYVHTNVQGTLNVLQAVRKHDVGRLVVTSTSEVYGSAQQIPISETHPLVGQSPYSASKIGADKIAESFYLSFETPVVTLRPFNTFGPRQSARAVIPTIISQLLQGSALQLGNLDPTRDFNYVMNTVDGFLAAGVAPDIHGKTINVGSGREISIGDLISLVADRIGVEVDLQKDEKRIRPSGSEVNRLLADASLAQNLLSWVPAISLEEGIDRTIDWIRDHQGAYRTSEYAV